MWALGQCVPQVSSCLQSIHKHVDDSIEDRDRERVSLVDSYLEGNSGSAPMRCGDLSNKPRVEGGHHALKFGGGMVEINGKVYKGMMYTPIGICQVQPAESE